MIAITDVKKPNASLKSLLNISPNYHEVTQQFRKRVWNLFQLTD